MSKKTEIAKRELAKRKNVHKTAPQRPRPNPAHGISIGPIDVFDILFGRLMRMCAPAPWLCRKCHITLTTPASSQPTEVYCPQCRRPMTQGHDEGVIETQSVTIMEPRLLEAPGLRGTVNSGSPEALEGQKGKE